MISKVSMKALIDLQASEVAFKKDVRWRRSEVVLVENQDLQVNKVSDLQRDGITNEVIGED